MELISVMRTFNRLEPVEIAPAGRKPTLYDSLIFANIAGMAKYGRISNSGRPNDDPGSALHRYNARRCATSGQRNGSLPRSPTLLR